MVFVAKSVFNRVGFERQSGIHAIDELHKEVSSVLFIPSSWSVFQPL